MNCIFGMTEFTPLLSAFGGALIGLSAAVMLAFNGRIAGISGILGGLVEGGEGRSWRGSFILGMVVGGLVLAQLVPTAFPPRGATTLPLWLLAIAGLLAGAGTRIGGGCTSGHGVCGVSRMSPSARASSSRLASASQA